MERVVRLTGYEMTTKYEGKGFNALLDHLQFWAPWLRKSKPGMGRFFVEERVDDIVETMSFLPDAYPQIESAFLSVDTNAGDTAGDEVRRWLLVAAHAAAPKKGIELMARVLEGKDIEVGLPLRRFTAGQLLQIDKDRAGAILHELLLAAMKSGASGRLGSQGLHPQQVFHYVDDYVASGHKEVERTLIKILQKTEYHDNFTIQRCVEHLGQMKSRSAVSRIKKLFWQQAPIPGQIPNPIFRRKCMIAIVDTIGAEAVPFLRMQAGGEKVENGEEPKGIFHNTW